MKSLSSLTPKQRYIYSNFIRKLITEYFPDHIEEHLESFEKLVWKALSKGDYFQSQGTFDYPAEKTVIGFTIPTEIFQMFGIK